MGTGRWADGRCRKLGARARGASGARVCGANGARGRQGVRAAGAQGGRCAGGRRESARGRGAAGRAELARHRHYARGHARPGRGLVRWLGQLGARAAGLVFSPVFRLGIFP